MDTIKLERFIFDKMSASRLPGLSIGLVQDGELVYARGFGQRDLSRGLAATPQTLYCIGSVTKSFTALAIMQLAEQGSLDLGDPVESYLPFSIKPKGKTVKLLHLLSHSVGIPALAYAEALLRHANGTGGRWLPIAGPEDILTFMAEAEDWVEAEPGKRWFYFNEGYALLGSIIEKVSGKSYNDYIHDKILEPLGMQRSFFAQDAVENDADVAVPYIISDHAETRPGRYLYRSIRSEGGLISNVEDMSSYLSMLLAGGQNIVSHASLETMSSPHVDLPHQGAPELFGDDFFNTQSPSPQRAYGYGFINDPNFLGETLIQHSGSVFTATAFLGFLPQRKLGVVVLANGSGYPLSQIGQVALSLMLEQNPHEQGFLKLDNNLESLTGVYESYKSTMRARISQAGNFLKLVFEDTTQTNEVILVPECLGMTEKQFFTLQAGQRITVTFKVGETTELIYERYKLKRSEAL